jgi:hypothetical protein
MTVDQRTVRSLYRKLLNLYPRAFREQLGESMEQTFTDLCQERKQQAEAGLFGFMLWLFVETALGIVQEHILLIKEMHPMQNILTSLRLPALISFLLVLPLVFLEVAFVVIKRLTFDLRDMLDSVVIFGFLWLAVTAILFILAPVVRTLRSGNNGLAKPVPASGNTLFTNPTSAALISFLLALPFVTILSLLILHIEPPLGPLAPWLNNPNPDQPNILGTLVVLGALLLAVAAGLIARGPIVRTLQAGGSLLAHPINLMLAVVILSFIIWLVVGLTADQFPCWTGVPNCD